MKNTINRENEKNDTLQNTETKEGRYTNCFQIGHNEFEFFIDLGQSCGEGVENFNSRIICAPFYANVLLKLLQTAVNQYEDDFGPITDGA